MSRGGTVAVMAQTNIPLGQERCRTSCASRGTTFRGGGTVHNDGGLPIQAEYISASSIGMAELSSRR